MPENEQLNKGFNIQPIVEMVIKVGVILLLIFLCLRIIKPFIFIFVWGVIIAIAVFPLYKSLEKKLKGRNKLAAILISALLLLILSIPTYFLADSLVDGIKQFAADIQNRNFSLSEPPVQIKEWPLIGEPVYEFWLSATENLGALLKKYDETLVNVGQRILNALLGTGIGILQLLLSVIIGGILLASSNNGIKLAQKFYNKLVGERANEFLLATEITIRNVAKGVLGVSLFQSLILGIIFTIAGVPYAGLWALLCLIFGVIQVGPMVITIPVIVYLFIFDPLWAAIIWGIVIILASLIDNFLKPILMGKGAPAPMLVIFLGAIGGFMLSGFIGLFLGAIVLSLGYKLFIAWLDPEKVLPNLD